MSNWLHQLESALREPSSSPRWIIAPTRIIGRQWLDRITLNGGYTLNVHVRTLRSIALDLAAPTIATKGLTMLGHHTGTAIVGEAWAQAVEQLSGPKHFQRLSVTPGLVTAWWRLVDEVRDAGLSPEDIRRTLASHHPAKAAELSALLERYEAILSTHALIDHAGLTRIAIDTLATHPIENDVHLFVPRSITERRSEQRLIRALRPAQLTWLDDDPQTMARLGDGIERDADLARFIATPASAPAPRGDTSVSFMSAMGERNEIRSVLRRLLGHGTFGADDMELIYTDRDTYAPLVYEILAGLADDARPGSGSGSKDDRTTLNATFADGIPVSLTRVGQALAGWISWQQSGFRQLELVRLLRAGLLVLPDALVNEAETRVSRSRLVAHLSSVTIRQGREQYLPALEDLIQLQKGRAAMSAGDRDPDDVSARRQRAETNLRELQTVHAFIAGLLACTPDDPSDTLAVLEGAQRLLRDFTGTQSGSDGRARKALIQSIDGMRLVVERTSLASAFDSLVWLGSMLGDLRIDASGPRPGAIHVSHALGGGHAGRPLVAFVGMDDGRVAVRLSEDPMLLDDDRAAVSSELPQAATRQRIRRDAWRQAIARVSAQEIWISCPRWDVIDQRELFPSMLMLNLFRMVSGNADTDLTHLLNAMPDVAGCGASLADSVTLDETEWWIRALCEPTTAARWPGLLDAHAPHLAEGMHAESVRNDRTQFSPWDGSVPDAGDALDLCGPDARPVSSSTLEMIARCPTDYFFRRGLRIATTEDQSFNPDVWLEPLDFGTMMHDVFRRFVQHLIDTGERADFDRHESLVRTILDDEMSTWKAQVPPPTEYAYRRQRRDAEIMTHVFLREESDYHEGTPRFVEASCGTPLDDDAASIARVEPVPLKLPGGRVIRLTGRIDRIDEVAPHQYYIWDYKTGKYWDKKFLTEDPYNAGRLLQHAVYIHLATTMLKTHDPEATVVGAGYIFPRLDGARRAFTSRTLTPHLPATIAHLVDLVRAGAFIPGCEEGDYGISGFKPIHGDVKTAARRYKAKLKNARDPRLDPLRILRGVTQ